MRKGLPLFVFIGFILLVSLVIIGLTRVNYQYSFENPGGNDFLARWMGARYWLKFGISPYDPQVSQATQRVFYGRLANKEAGEDLAHFIYPLTSMIFFAPFGLIEYVQARAIWMTIIEVSLFFLAILSIKLVDWDISTIKNAILVIFTIIWYHGLRTIFLGQFAAIEALLITVALLMIKNNKDFSAGLFLALATSKPQLSYLIITFILLWSIYQRRLEILWGFLMVGGLLLALSLVFIPEWPLQMLRQILEYPTYTDTISSLEIIASSLPGIKDRLNLILHGIFIAYLLVTWAFTLKKDYKSFIWTAFLTLVITNLITVRTATTNYMVLLPVFFFILRYTEERWRLSGRFFVGILLLGFLVGLWWLFLTTVQGNQEHAWMYLPLPIFCLIGLWWVHWWHLNSSRFLIDKMYNQSSSK